MRAKSRREVLEQVRRRYGGRGKEGRGRLLDEVCALCGYERKYASKVLRGQRAIAGSAGWRRGGWQALYGEAERAVLKVIWLAAEQPCGNPESFRGGAVCLITRSAKGVCRERCAAKCSG